MFKIKAKKKGTAKITTTAINSNQKLVTEDTVIVTDELNINMPTNSRDLGYSGKYTITGVKIINPINKICVGEEYVLIGYAIPVYWLQDNLVKFTSSNPDIASVTFGILKGNSVGTATITCSAIGTEYTESFDITVEEKEEYVYNDSEIYKMQTPSATDSTTITNWIISAINYAKNNVYKKILFPNGGMTYHVSPEAVLGDDTTDGANIDRTCIYIPSNLCIDLNGCTIQIDASVWSDYATGVGTQGGYAFFAFGTNDKYCENSSIINGKISGDVEQLESIYSGCEHNKAIIFNNAVNCGIDNLETYNSSGFNITTNAASHNGIGGAAYVKYQYVEEGGFNDDGSAREEELSWRTTSKLSVHFDKSVSKYYQLGSVWGKVSEFIDATLYDIIWYDEYDNVIDVSRNNLVYYSYKIPDGAAKADVVIHQNDKPTETNGLTSYCFAPLFQFIGSIKCYITNCTIHNNTSTGIALVGGQHNIVRGNVFYDNGYRDPSSHIDMEDGGDTMHGTIIAENTFQNSQGYVLFIVGRNVAVHNNIFNCFTRGARCYNFRIYANQFNYGSIGNFVYSGDCIFAYNYGKGGYNPTPRNALTDTYPGYYKFYSFDNSNADGSPNNIGTSLNL